MEMTSAYKLNTMKTFVVFLSDETQKEKKSRK